jgi:phosphate transport system substrate-binding protein
MKRLVIILPVIFILFLSCRKRQDSIKIKGSDTEVNLVIKLAEEFRKNNSEVYISITGGGSGLGIASLLNGQADIANSSRPINAYETALFVQKGIGLDTFRFAEDAIAFIVSSDLPLDTIWVQDLGKVLSGVYTNWSALTGKDLPINIYGRPSNSGTHGFVKKKLSIEFSENARQMNGNAQIIEAIKTDHSGIGYVGSSYVRQGIFGKKTIKVLRIASDRNCVSISPLDSTAIAENRYFFQRPLYQYIRGVSAEKVSAFIDFEKSSKGAKIIKSSGYYQIPDKKIEHK